MVDAANGKTALISVAAGEETKDVDAGVEVDENGDGVDNGEAGDDARRLPFRCWRSQSENKNFIAANVGDKTQSTQTAATDFDDVDAGEYVVMFEDSQSENKNFIAANVGDDDAIDSDVVDAANGKTALISVAAGEETKDVDAGVEDQPGAISGRYFCDENGDGVDNGEAGVADKTVTLLAADGVTISLVA